MTTWLARLGAITLLITILGAAALLWPIPYLGFSPDLHSNVIIAVDPGSVAERAGLQVGDRIVAIYDYPWAEVDTRLFVVPLPWQPGTPTPVVIDRNGQQQTIILRSDLPAPAEQLTLAIRTIFALVCWATGALLIASPRAIDPRLRRAGWSWMLLGAILSLYLLCSVTSYQLSIALLWALCTILAPLGVAMHCWYPPRPLSHTTQRNTRIALLVASGLLQVGALWLILSAPSARIAFIRLMGAAQIVFFLSFIASVALLTQAYRATQIAHIRRQIRLIASASLLTACWWLFVILLQVTAPDLAAHVPNGTLMVGALLIPLSYLVGGVRADLMHIDRVARRALVHALTALIVMVLLTGAAHLGLWPAPATLALLAGLAIYQPLAVLARSLLAGPLLGAEQDPALHTISQQLGTSLHTPALASLLSDGLQRAFQAPVAIYGRPDPDQAQLVQLAGAGLAPLPPSIPLASLEPLLADRPPTIPAALLQQPGAERSADGATTDLRFHPAVLLWGAIRISGGPLLGLVLLGPRHDQDPYRPQDIQALEQLLATAALAFTNSTRYAAQVAAEQTIRQLYYRMQQTQERTAAQIAREIHDEVLSIVIHSHIQALQHLINRVSAADIRADLEDLLASEQQTSEDLRRICSRLQPASLSEPLGLVSSLQRQIQQARLIWNGAIDLEVSNPSVPISAEVHRELVRIVQEAISNAIKHADATMIQVQLRFPAAPGEPLSVRIADDGRSQRLLAAAPGHWGLRYMQESASQIDGTIRWERPASGGTHVIIDVPLPEIIGPGGERNGASAPEPGSSDNALAPNRIPS